MGVPSGRCLESLFAGAGLALAAVCDTACEARSRNSLRRAARAPLTSHRSEPETAHSSATGRSARRAIRFLRR